MKEVKVICPYCGKVMTFKNYWHWIWKTPFHMLGWDRESKSIRDYRFTQCPICEYKWFMKRVKDNEM